MKTTKKDLFDKMEAMLQEVSESATTEYREGEDDPGACIHCQKISYKPHANDCIITRVRNLLKELKENA